MVTSRLRSGRPSRPARSLDQRDRNISFALMGVASASRVAALSAPCVDGSASVRTPQAGLRRSPILRPVRGVSRGLTGADRFGCRTQGHGHRRVRCPLGGAAILRWPRLTAGLDHGAGRASVFSAPPLTGRSRGHRFHSEVFVYNGCSFNYARREYPQPASCQSQAPVARWWNPHGATLRIVIFWLQETSFRFAPKAEHRQCWTPTLTSIISPAGTISASNRRRTST